MMNYLLSNLKSFLSGPRRGLLYGVVVWGVPFIFSIIIYPIKNTQSSLFESVMPLIVTFVTIEMSFYYLRKVKKDFEKEGFYIGFVWLFMSILIDLPLFLIGGPMKMDFFEYMSDIGTTYFIIPVITTGFGFFAKEIKLGKAK